MIDDDDDDCSPATRQIRRFHARHGGICFPDGAGFLVYPNGAFREIGPAGVLAEPLPEDTPENEHTNARNVLKFYRLKLKAAVRDFDNLNEALSAMVPDDENEALTKLQILQGQVLVAKREVKAAEKKLAGTELAKRHRLAEEEKLEEEERQAFQEKRRAIRI
jgi:hypothetical protein